MRTIRILFPILLILMVLILGITNFQPNTYLSGWDTIHPEFNFSEYFSRILSVWQEHQGLGAVAAQAHAGELPRFVIYYFSSFFLPSNFLRYFYFFATLIIGPLGVYFFVKETVKNKITEVSTNIVSFLSALYFLLNFAVLQQFTVPLEMFATHYATIGWLFLFSTKYILAKNYKFLLLFTITAIFSASMAHTPTLFYVFAGIFSIYLVTLSLLSKVSLKRAGLIFSILILLNFYWILPNIYYVINYGEAVVSSKINSQFSDQAIQTGLNFGNPIDTAILRNFLFDWGEYDTNKKTFEYLLKNWSNHLQNPRILFIGFLMFFVSLIGFILSIKKKDPKAISLIPVLLISFFFISSDNPFYSFVIENLKSKIPILNEALRFPFTKFSILLQFAYSVFFGYALIYLIQTLSLKKVKSLDTNNFHLIHSHVRERIFGFIVFLIITPLLIIYVSPFFAGNLINPIVKTKIPAEYFQTFDFFNKQSKFQRVALLPVNTFWAWSYYDWDYEGAGFLWFGIKQPLLNREFDRWMPYNENFYWELQRAIYSKDSELLRSVFDKYQVNWIILDENTIDPASEKILFYPETEELLISLPNISLEEEYRNIKIYKVENETISNNFISLLDNLPTVGPSYQWQDNDKAFSEFGNYISSNTLTPDVYYPFRSLFSNHVQNNIDLFVSETPNAIIFRTTIPFDSSNYEIKELDPASNTIPWIDPNNLSSRGVVVPEVSLLNSTLTITVPKIGSFYNAEIIPSQNPNKARNCDSLRQSKLGKKIGKVNNEVISTGDKEYLRISSILANNCSAEYELPNLPYNLGYLVSIESKNTKNKSLLFRLENLSTKRSDIETFLPQSPNLTTTYFIVPPTSGNGSGYIMHFDNYSYNKIGTVNDLGNISVYPIPYELLTGIQLEKKNSSFLSDNREASITKVVHPSSVFYNASFAGKEGEVLTLFQSFDKGWHAYKIRGLDIKPLKEHVLINSWANGWILKENFSDTVWIVFIPQLLLIIGLGVFTSTIFLVIFYGIHNKKNS